MLANTNLRLQDQVDDAATKSDAAIKSKAYLEEIDELKTKLKTRNAEFDELTDKYKQATATGEAKKSA